MHFSKKTVELRLRFFFVGIVLASSTDNVVSLLDGDKY